jgi:4-carboxymuconolactone decarboxylase
MMGVQLIEDLKTTDSENGAPIEIFGEGMRENWVQGPRERATVNRWLAANCFGDYQTRRGLDARQRELLTFAMLVSLGGCESQVKGHIRGNVAAGNDRRVLLGAVMQLLPYIGYPRTLNAVACLEEVLPADAR